jgi:hypothetical protein
MKHYTILIAIITVCILGCKTTNQTSQTKVELNYNIKDNLFYVNDKSIPPGCIAQLMTELNGDNVQGTIYLERNSLRGCLTANYTYLPDSMEKYLSYTINEQLPEDTYKITISEKIDGSLKVSKNKIIVQFINKPYILADGSTKMVLSLDKKGDW